MDIRRPSQAHTGRGREVFGHHGLARHATRTGAADAQLIRVAARHWRLSGEMSGRAVPCAGYGTANYELDVKMKRNHRMTIGSNTKFMTAVAVWQLHERGLLHVDDLVSKVRRPVNMPRQVP